MKGISTEVVSNKKAFLGWISSKVREKAAEMYNEKGKVLDIGCGNGLLIAMLGAKGVDTSGITGMDYSSRLLYEARDVFNANLQKGAPLIHGNFFDLPFKDNTFDDLFLLNTTMNLEDADLEELLAEVSRILLPGGRMYLDIRNAESHIIKWRYLINMKRGNVFVRAYKLDEFRKVLKRAGFNVLSVESIGLKSRFITPAYVLKVSKER